MQMPHLNCPNYLRRCPIKCLPNQVVKLGDKNSAGATQGLKPIEIGGVAGPDPTRYGDWEHKGRCYDF